MYFNDNTYNSINTSPHEYGQYGMTAEQWLLSPRAALAAPVDDGKIHEPTTSDV